MSAPQEVVAGAGWGNLSLDEPPQPSTQPRTQPSTTSRSAPVANARPNAATSAQAQMPDSSRWNCIYPAYIDKKKSSKQGRRVVATLAAENPQAFEIADCCIHFKLPTIIEPNKSYARDFLQPGRVKVQIKREDGSLVNPAIPNRKKLLEEVAKLVPKHKERQKKAVEPPAGANTVSSKSGKSGKKKK